MRFQTRMTLIHTELTQSLDELERCNEALEGASERPLSQHAENALARGRVYSRLASLHVALAGLLLADAAEQTATQNTNGSDWPNGSWEKSDKALAFPPPPCVH